MINSALLEKLDNLLPQTQCTKCGFQGCLPYAQAIADGQADINRCSPGGEATVKALADLMQQSIKPLAEDVAVSDLHSVAFIDEDRCIGCALCLKACPVDAIVGARKWMHTVIAQDCTSCELCVPRCPVDCISMIKKSDHVLPDADTNRARYIKHQQLFTTRAENAAVSSSDKQAAIKAALARKKIL